jgi:hypothetical protein
VFRGFDPLRVRLRILLPWLRPPKDKFGTAPFHI